MDLMQNSDLRATNIQGFNCMHYAASAGNSKSIERIEKWCRFKQKMATGVEPQEGQIIDEMRELLNTESLNG